MENQQQEQQSQEQKKNNKNGIWIGIIVAIAFVLLLVFVIIPATKDDEDAATNTTTSLSPVNNDGNTSIVDYAIELSEFSYSPAKIQIEPGETIQVKLTNNGGVSHNFVIDELDVDSGFISPGGEKTITITSGKTGSYSFYCSVGSHRQSGMEGDITVQ